MRRLLALLIIALLVVSFAATAQEEEEIEIEELEEIQEHEREREVNIKPGADRVEIESKLEKEGIEGELENKFEVEFKVSEEVEIKLEYEDKFELNLTERELEYEVEFDSIIEFVDVNGNGVYDKGEEVSVYKLDGAEFTPISYTTRITPGNVTEHVIATQTLDGIFGVTLHAVGNFADIEGEIVKPTEIKIDLAINNYNYTNETSKLALKTKIKSVMETEEEKKVKGREEEVKIKSGNYTGFFSWRKTALVDGIEKPVLSTSLAENLEENSKELYLIYERGITIAHDPKIGIIIAAVPPIFITPNLTYLYFAIAAIVVVAIAVYVLRKSL